MFEAVALALVVSVIAPFLLAYIQGRQRRADKTQDAEIRAQQKEDDWEREDKLAAAAATAAATAVVTVVGKLDGLSAGVDQVHALVNSEKTASMQDSHDTAVLWLAALQDKNGGHSEDTAKAIELAKTKIADLAAKLKERAITQAAVDAMPTDPEAS